MHLRWRASIRAQLLALVLAVALPLLALVSFAAYLELRRAAENAHATAHSLAALTAAHIDQLLQESMTILAEVADRPQMRGFEPAHCDPFLREIPHLFPQYAGMGLVNTRGEVLCTAVTPPGTVSASVADRTWFQEVMRTEQFTVSEALVGRVQGIWVTILAYPVYDFEGQLAGALVMPIDLVRYQTALAQVSLPGTIITVVDGRSVVLARSQDAEQYVGQVMRNDELMRLALVEGSSIRSTGIDGIPKFYGMMRVPNTNWIAYTGIPTNVALGSVRHNLIQFGLAAVAIIVFVSLLALYLMQQIERPAQALARLAAAVATGQVERRAETAGPEEFRAVAVQFNRMLDAHSRHQAAIQEYARQLEIANQELESFAYSVSHDLRAHLRALDGYGDMLQSGYGDQLDEQGSHYLERMLAAGRRMGQLIEDLLKLSRVSRQEMRIGRVNLSDLTRDIVTELQQRTPQRPVTIKIADNCVASGDERLLRIALENLLENAWKFTSKNVQAQVEFGCAPQAEEDNVFFVCDNGIGFDMAYSKKLFGAFQRLHSAEEFPGTGIGLATVQRVIQRHGGRVWAESAAQQGATFFFTLPGRVEEPLLNGR
jgi:signal transduction histidine kinase